MNACSIVSLQMDRQGLEAKLPSFIWRMHSALRLSRTGFTGDAERLSPCSAKMDLAHRQLMWTGECREQCRGGSRESHVAPDRRGRKASRTSLVRLFSFTSRKHREPNQYSTPPYFLAKNCRGCRRYFQTNTTL